jgi:hypothetical protein
VLDAVVARMAAPGLFDQDVVASGRGRGGDEGGRAALLDGFDEAVRAIPASLNLSAPA